jgi:hypothetical protein
MSRELNELNAAVAARERAESARAQQQAEAAQR